ncbi:PAS domain S-box protein [Salinimicrobium oceani]|uniref:histidine kinase n=1 Tax=Salinimicrobium oceani TaxID=2722702 RepID=A0ABX1D3F3_9FLAO|nr:PAS domain S-box protein [Salinimicrobium oceani]NJW53051.1 PAS domain S-box protein [Salinimicrobium oceani]
MGNDINRRSTPSDTLGVGFQQMFDESPIAFYTCDAEGHIFYFNKAASNLWGRSPVIGKDKWCGSWKKFYADGTPMPLEESPMANAVKTGQAEEKTEIRIQRPDGSFRSLLAFPRPLFDSDGKLCGANNTLVDITEQQRDQVKKATLSAIVESSDDAIISKDLNGVITSWNAGAQRIFGYSEEEAIGQHITMLIPKDRLSEEDEIISNIRQGNRVDHIETVRVDKNGRQIPISVTVSPLKDASGRIVGASKVARDISDRIRADEKHARLSAIVESSGDAIISKNLEGIISSWNKGAEKIFGYTEDEVIGKSITILIPKERLDEETVILSKIRNGLALDHFETIRRHKSGREIPISITVSPIMDSKGQVIGASKVARDISFQVQANEAREKYTRNLEMLNTVGKSISENLDVQGILQRVTDATTKLSGAAFGAFFYNNVDREGNSFQLFTLSGAPREIFEQFAMPRHTEMFLPTFVEKKVVRVDDIRKHSSHGKNAPFFGMPKGHFPVVSYLAVPVISKSGGVIGGLLYGHPEPGVFTAEHELLVVNIAAQAAVSLDNSRLFEQVKSLSEKKDEFIALASHELKTPLTTIKGYLQVLAKKSQDDLSELFLKKSLNQVDKLNTLVEDLLNMSRIESGRLNFNIEVFDLKVMLGEIIETFTWSAQSHKIVSDLGNSEAIIEGDSQRIEQAILNLMTNAIKYSPKAEEVYINLEVIDDEVTVRVRDEGIGLTNEQKEQLFTRFYRAEDTKGISGLGLGLYLTKQIIDRHNGIIKVNSEYGRGSEFYFSLPLKKKKIKNAKVV